MVVFVMTGLPASGRTDSANLLGIHLDTHGVDYETVMSTNPNKGAARAEVANQVFQYIASGAKYVIVDMDFQDTFDRAGLIESVKKAWAIRMDKEPNETPKIVAINHVRSNKFIYELNTAEGDKHTEAYIKKAFTRYQQPVYREGFDFIFNLTGERHLDPNMLGVCLDKNIDHEFPYTASKDTVTVEDSNV